RVADRDAGALVDVRGAAELTGGRREDLQHVDGNAHRNAARRLTRLQLHDPDLLLRGLRIVRADLRAETILERRDDASAVRVVVGVRRRDDEEIEREPDPIAADLDVA